MNFNGRKIELIIQICLAIMLCGVIFYTSQDITTKIGSAVGCVLVTGTFLLEYIFFKKRHKKQ